jgi:hypothetical protein
MLQPRILGVEAIETYKLKLRYETGEVRIFDVKPYIQGDWFCELLNREYFAKVKVLQGGIGIEWENGHDIAPHELYELSITTS